VSAPDPRFHTVDAEDWSDCLRSIDALGRAYSEPEQFVDGFLTVGLTVVSATPKAGKTWLAHECAIGVATGHNALGTLPCVRSEVLCAFLEDSERRGILRERTLLGHASGCAGITYAWVGSKWSLDRLARWLDLHPACRVVIVDTAERYKQMQGAAESSGRVYADDYRFWGALQEFAISRSIALILIHHDRKPNGAGGNVLDTVSGTRAITGAADHVWLLERNSETGVSTLKVVGRDLDEKSVQFSRGGDGQLRAVETPVLDTVARIEQRVRARRMRDDGVSFRDIAKALGVSKTTVERWCQDADGQQCGVSHFSPFPPTHPPRGTARGVVVRGCPAPVPQYGTNKKSRLRAGRQRIFVPLGCPMVSRCWHHMLNTWPAGCPYCGTGAGHPAQ
jgi:AAA domain/Helix-turn-helix domain